MNEVNLLFLQSLLFGVVIGVSVTLVIAYVFRPKVIITPAQQKPANIVHVPRKRFFGTAKRLCSEHLKDLKRGKLVVVDEKNCSQCPKNKLD